MAGQMQIEAAGHHDKGDHGMAGKHLAFAHEAPVAAYKAFIKAHGKSKSKPAHVRA